jgi:hypothetical protein
MKASLLDASGKEKYLEINSDKRKYIFMICTYNAGRNKI